MATKKQTTAIEWVKNSDGTAGYAINLWIGCSKISPACDNCYAETSRVSTCLGVKWGNDNPRKKCNPYKKLTAINKKADKAGIHIRVFINPDSDIFDNKAPQEWRDEFFSFVWSTPSIDYIWVTKRIGNAKKMIPQAWLENGYPANVWQLITVCNQGEADRGISNLFLMPYIRVHGLSIEPMLAEIDLSKYINSLNWVIVGGEGGKNARPMNPNWARKIRDQCVDAGVPFFFKQWGEWLPNCQGEYLFDTGVFRKLGDDFKYLTYKVGKKLAGNLLDGQVWQQMPVAKK
jgi:protein gp37